MILKTLFPEFTRAGGVVVNFLFEKLDFQEGYEQEKNLNSFILRFFNPVLEKNQGCGPLRLSIRNCSIHASSKELSNFIIFKQSV